MSLLAVMEAIAAEAAAAGTQIANSEFGSKLQSFPNKIFNEENINEAKKIIKKEFDPIDDMRASKNYRTKISQNLLERFLYENNKIKSTLY